MPTFKAPLQDIRFVLNELFDYPAHYRALPNGENADPETVDAILGECARFSEEVLAPLNQSGDKEGCHIDGGNVTTPKGFKEAYALYVKGGWQGLAHPVEYGGQRLPMSMNVLKAELMGTANWAFTMYPGLSLGAMNTIMMHGDDALKMRYMPALTEGRWTGTMCLTEAQCGSDLGQVATRAELQPDGSYKLTGTKIFISAGEHDFAENIVHVVLARTTDAPPGIKGISLFVVPKYLPSTDGGVGVFNHVSCGSIEHKMGINGSVTAVLNFDGATGHMIAEKNKGMKAMFTFINSARVGNAVQGVAHAELSYQGALAYAKDRRSMRALSGKKEPTQVADAIIHHADVRRMLMTQRAIAEGGRSMIYFAAKFADHMANAIADGDTKEYERWDDQLGFYTPILKGFLTEMGLEAANLGVQVFGGHGYVREHGMEQIVRDARISTLYEGTTGIQALDLLGRKVLLGTRGKAVRDFTAMMARLASRLVVHTELRGYAPTLARYATEWNVLTTRIMFKARKDPDTVSSASYHFLMYSGYACMGYFWALQAEKAHEKLTRGGGAAQPEFYRAKLALCRFYFDHMLPRARGHAASMVRPSATLTDLPVEHFAF